MRHVTTLPGTLLPVTCLLVLALAGCFGGEERSEWAYEVTQLDAAKAEGKTGAGVIVAVLDTGINVGHSSLDHLVDGKKENGELVAFKDFYSGKEGVKEAFDDDGHGSHVIGIMSARGSSAADKVVYGGIDLKGGSPNVQLVVGRVCKTDSCNADQIPGAVKWAVDQGAAIISLSLGGEGGLRGPISNFIQTAIEEAINDAIDRGVVVIAAAGNGGVESTDVETPGRIPNVIAVGAIQSNGKVADISSRGDEQANRCGGTLPPPVGQVGRCDPDKKPELVAPGVNILSAWIDDKYVRASGTSQAVPFVTATVALMLEGKPRLNDAGDVDHLKRVLAATAQDVPGQVQPHDVAAGYGLVQAKTALDAY